MNFQMVWEQNREAFQDLIRIPSVYDEATASPEAPYGKSVREALAFMQGLCEKKGLTTKVYDQVALAATWGAKGQEDPSERIDIVSHLDVVSVADDWDLDPFSGSLQDGFVLGRGTQDMKSGAFLTFLALTMAKEEAERRGLEPQRPIRLVYGSDEERTMEDMRLYVKKAGLPAFAFTPDGTFPMICGEKGALMWIMSGPCTVPVLRMDAGIQPNIVPPVAMAVLPKALAAKSSDCQISCQDIQSAIKAMDIRATAEETEEGILITVEGKGAHASKPEEGHNATSDLLALLAAVTGEEQTKKLAAFFADGYAEGTELRCDIPPMGPLSLNMGVLKIQNGELYAMIDSRYPYGISSDELTRRLQKAFPEYQVELPYDDPPTLTKPEDPFIQQLREAYKEVTGRECETGISGGVSYSKVFGHSVTFGAVAEGSEQLMHQKNEKISEADCVEALEIYYRAIMKLAGLDEPCHSA